MAILALVPAGDLDPQGGVFHAITIGSVALKLGALGILAAVLVTFGDAGGVGSTVAGIARVPFVVGIDRYLPAAFGKIHPKWKTPYVSILVQAIASGAILLGSQINDTTRGAYQVLIDAAIILYFIPFLYMFAASIKLAGRRDRTENAHAVLVPGGKAGVWVCAGLGFVVVLLGILVSLVPPGDSTDKFGFEMKLVVGTVASVLLGLVLYWRGARASSQNVTPSIQEMLLRRSIESGFELAEAWRREDGVSSFTVMATAGIRKTIEFKTHISAPAAT